MVLDLSRTYDALGQFKLEILRATTGTAPFGPDIKGTLTEYTNTGHHVVSTTARLGRPRFWTSNRRVGLAFGFINATGNLVVLKSDSTGSRKLYNAPDGETQNITDYSQTIDPQGHAVADITFGRFAGTYALHFTSTGVSMIGDGTNIRVGG